MEQRPGSEQAIDLQPASGALLAGALTIMDASPNPVVGIDRTGAIRYLNPRAEASFGYGRTELLGQQLDVLLPASAKAHHGTQVTAFLAHPVARPLGIGMDLAARRKDGSEFPVEISLAPVESAQGTHVFATVVDITTRKSVENQLLQAQKLESIGRLAGGIAHDFNNVLFAIRGYAELLAEDLSVDRRASFDPDEALQNVEAIGAAATRAAVLTAQLANDAGPRPAAVRSGRLMVVEDEPSVREVTTTVLRRAGYEVLAAEDGGDALTRLQSLSSPIDVLVTDVVMPGMSGIDLAEQVLDSFPHAGVVLLSGYTAETLDLERVVKRGGIFLSKPVASDELLDAVGHAADRRSTTHWDRP